MASITKSFLLGCLFLALAFNIPAGSHLTASVALAAGMNYFVDNAIGTDLNPGTQALPWKTIQKAADTMVAGDSVTVMAGVYDERIKITKSGSSGTPITYQVEGTVTMNGFTIRANYISIIGFEITNTPDLWDDGWGIYVEGSNCDFENNYIHFATRGGIRVFVKQIGMETGTSNCTVRNNRLYRNATAGIEVFGRNNRVEGNEIWGTIQYHPNWKNPPSSVDADGMRFFGSGHIIRGNYIHDISYRDPENINPHIDCFQTWAGSDREVGHNIIFEKNVCLNLEVQTTYENGQGFMLEGGAKNITIRNNIIRAYKIVNTIDSSNLTIINNTFTNDLSLPKDFHPMMFSLTRSPITIIKNNILYDPEGTIVGMDDAQSMQGLDVGYNCVYRSDGKNPSGEPYPHDLWQVNPLFVNAEAGDFHLLPNSPAINAGIMINTVVADFDGLPRPLGSGFDMGAYEYLPYRINTSPPIVHKNDTLNITISYATIGQPITITSIMPAQLDYLSSSASCPATVTYSDQTRTVTLTGNPPPASDCDLQIYTKVNTDQRVPVTVSAKIDNGISKPQNISRTIILNGIPLYLVFIIKTH